MRLAGRALTLTGVIILLTVSCNAQRPVHPGVNKFMIPMRDGVKLATLVELPDGDGPWPVLLSRTPYNKETSLERGAFTRYGVVRVVQDLRGRFESEGVDSVFLTDGWGEAQDGYDTIEWIAAQPWCNGKIGMTGGSALGITQYLAAGAGPEALVCCHVAVGAPSLYHHAAFPGGAFGKALVEDWTRDNNFSEHAIKNALNNPVYNDVWRCVDLLARASQVTVPMMHIGGWYDVFAQGTLDAFDALQHKGGEGARGHQRLVIGPWTHGMQPTGDLNFPASAHKNPANELSAPWLAHYLLGLDSPILEEQLPVHYYVMGACGEPGAPGNEWRNVADWPEPSTPVPVYFHESGRLALEAPEDPSASRMFRYDPANPVPTVGGCNLTIPAGPKDQRPVESRPDVLVFTSDPLPEPVEVTGRLKAKLFVSSDCPDTDFTVKLTDVYPDGRSMLVADGILRMRFREGFDREVFMEPGGLYEADVDLWSTSLVFNKGHRVRVAVSSSNAPRFDPNPNTGAGFRANAETRIAHNTLHVSKAHPSHIILPVR